MNVWESTFTSRYSDDIFKDVIRVIADDIKDAIAITEHYLLKNYRDDKVIINCRYLLEAQSLIQKEVT